MFDVIFASFARFYKVFYRIKEGDNRYQYYNSYNKPIPVTFRAGAMGEFFGNFRLLALAGIAR